MTTNDEIKYKGGVELANNKSLESVIDKMLKEARADTAKQIFAELDKITRVYPNELYEQDVWVIFTENKEYQTLKKKYKVD